MAINSNRSTVRPADAPELLRRSIEFVIPERGRLAGVVALALLTAALGAAEPLTLKFALDELSGRQSIPAFAAIVAGILLLELARAVLTGRLSILAWDLRIRTDYRVRERVLQRLTALPISFHRGGSVGGTINTINQSIQGFLNTLTEVSLNIVPAVVYLALSLVAMFRMEWRMSLIVIALAPLPTLLGMWAAGEQARRERYLLETWSRLYGRLSEVLTGILTVKGFAQEHAELDRFLTGTREGNAVVLAGTRRDTINASARTFITTLARIAAIGFGGYLVIVGQTTIGTLFAFLGYINGLFGPVQGLTNVYQTLRRGMIGAEAIYEILDQEDAVADLPGASDLGRVYGQVAFQNVRFGYSEGEEILHGIDLKVNPGETVALVGPSGAGKTTLVTLLQRQYNVTGGAIQIDGKDIRNLKLHALRRNVGVVFQDVHLFNETVHDNIAYAVPGATRERVEAAARSANAHDFIMQLPEGYDTVLGERGSRLSGGQKQRIAIGRAFLADPPILVLDEATSALDAESEHFVQQALQSLSYGRTTIVIAHRLSTVVGADRIVVLRDGHVEAIGRHDDLMRECDYYARLVRHQASGFLTGDLRVDALAA
ncbi:MAG TPA: ABC transporter ATP-binding protein [Rhodothermales bacterium]|nr:ABC transporter ATP-binding protein [Rhodothermales bacterium]